MQKDRYILYCTGLLAPSFDFALAKRENVGREVMPPEHGDPSPPLAASTVSVGVCPCCFVWEVTRGPHAGERVAFDALKTPQATLGVGRKSSCWLRLRKDLEVSGLHAEVKVTYKHEGSNPDAVVSLALSDANSTNGTRVNGQLLASGVPHVVNDQDLVQFGRTTVRMRMGNTQCLRAQKEEKELLVLANEPEDEPVVALAFESPQEETNEEDPTSRVGTSNEHSDENAFEEPTTARPVESVSSALLDVCVVCGQALAAWSMLEQQLHVNACLDRRANTAPMASKAKPTKPTIVNANTNSKKRKRQTKLLQDEELAVALALSESLVDKEQQVDTEIALVSGELAQLDAQLKKMQKKRTALVKKLEKLEKTKKKVHKSEVVGPEETQLRLDLGAALRVLFPRGREAQRMREESGGARVMRPAVGRLVEKYRALEEETAETYVTMWTRCMQLGGGGERGAADETMERMEKEDERLYVNRLLQRLRVREEESAKRAGEKMEEGAKEVIVMEEQLVMEETAVENTQAQSTGDVPEVVKRVFPLWQENLAFLATQSLSDLRDALEQLRRMMADRQQQQQEEGEQLGGEGSPDKDDEALACAFFEQEMLRLMAERREHETSGLRDVVVLVDSQDIEENDVGMPHDRDEDNLQRVDKTPSILSIDDSSDEEEKSALDDDMARAAAREGVRASLELQMEEQERATMDNGTIEDVMSCEAGEENPQTRDDQPINGRLITEAVATTMPSVPIESVVTAEDTRHRPQSVAPVEDSNEARLERQLLTALKANATIYECVLMLQPLDLQQLLQYVRDDAGIKCPKTALVKFCDRHGITFKST
jgi:hypothetical protein